MRPVSGAFLAALRGSHNLAVRATVVPPGQVGTSPVGTDLVVLRGDVRQDANADVRSTLDLTVDGAGLWPADAAGLLAPYGNEIHIRRGVKLASGVEYASLGFFRIEGIEQDQANGPIRVTARDRMAAIVEARLLAPISYPSSATYGQVLNEQVLEVYPSADIVWDDGTDAQQLGRDLIADEDRYAFLNEMIISVGKIWYWDDGGRLQVRTPPDPSTPVWDVTHGPDGVLVSLGRQLSRDGVYNAVVARGEAASETAPAYGVATDNNPASPTFFGGPFGRVPRFYSSPFIVTDAQAVQAAEGILQRVRGLVYQVDFSAIPNPALEPLDPVRVSYTDGAPAEIHIIESLTIPLSPKDAGRGATREQARTL